LRSGHRRHEHHADSGQGSHARDRDSQGARRHHAHDRPPVLPRELLPDRRVGGIGMVLGVGLCTLINLAPMPERFSGMIVTPRIAFIALATLALVGVARPPCPRGGRRNCPRPRRCGTRCRESAMSDTLTTQPYAAPYARATRVARRRPGSSPVTCSRKWRARPSMVYREPPEGRAVRCLEFPGASCRS